MTTQAGLLGLVDRKKNFKIAGTYGVPYLDDYLLGIHSEDLVLIAAEAGVGKSEIVYEIAFRNSLEKHVHLFALECDAGEPLYRKIYKLIAKMYYDNSFRVYKDLTYRNYITNSIEVSDYEKKALYEIADKYSKLHIHYREKKFDVGDLIEQVKYAATEEKACDMIIIDHVDYFDLDDDESENREVTKIMKTIRAINIEYRIPIIVVSHLRKKHHRTQIVPNIDDLMGSSNKAKQVKTVIMMARDYECSHPEAGKHSTFFHVAKSRVCGASNLIGQCIFDSFKNQYDDYYAICRIKNFGDEIEKLDEHNYPNWSSMKETK